ncbi:unnamed protein product [Soboliphyme baturini]|uniref:Importin N-terminal domain-containing protein n=1 Tax=Soboliphyme baturini TaxID=241478 RepID=A0A183IGI3_9BILA|nr:unnamed protein product [Soboliphyme baturini]
MDNIAEFSQLLEKLLSSDNTVRKEAEEVFEKIDKCQKASALFVAAKTNELSVEGRKTALVLLRRLLTSSWNDVWDNWSPEVKESFKAELLTLVRMNQPEILRKQMCKVIAEVSRNSIDDDAAQTWPEVLKFMFECVQSNENHCKQTALDIIESVPSVFGNQQAHYLPVIKNMLMACLTFQDSLDVRMAAMKATVAFVIDNVEDMTLAKSFQPLTRPILAVCAETIEKGEDDCCLLALTELTGSVPKMFRADLSELHSLFLKTMANKQIDSNFRHAMLEAMVSLCEEAPPLVRKEGSQIIPDMIQQCLALMVDIEDDEDWATADDYEDEDSDSSAVVGETSLDRLACCLGGKVFLQPCLQFISPMLSNADWKYRYAGLMALSTIGEGCHRQMETILDKVVDCLLPYLRDANPRVRYAACNAAGQLSTDFAPTLQKRYHQKLLPELMLVLEDLENPRVAAHAAAALVNFCEDAPKNVVTMYLEALMQKLEFVLQHTFKALLEKGKKLVLEQVITTIASVADSAEESFITYYDRVMPCLKYILQNAIQPELRMLRGKTTECISLIGLSVGKEKVSYMISAWARLCKVLGKDFQQYLPLVMPTVMNTAALKPEMTLVEEEDAEGLQEEDNEWQFLNIGDKQSFGIRTAGLEDKATACQMLVCYARELKESFADYVEPVTKLMVPLLRFYFHDGVRTAAAESLPYLLEAAKVKGAVFVSQMWRYIFPELVQSIPADSDNNVITELMWSLAKCIECLGANCLSNEDMEKIADMLEKYLIKHFENEIKREETRKGEDYDEEVENELADEHDDDTFVLGKMSDILHSMFQTHTEAVVPYFDKLVSYIFQLVEPTRPYGDRQWGICMFDDIFEFGGAASVKYLPRILPCMIAGLQDAYPEVRQAAAYGIGIMAMCGGNACAQACSESLPYLIKMIRDPNARSTEAMSSATENAISAVAKIMKYNCSMIDASLILPAFISWLPIWEDKEEVPHVGEFFCDLIESNNPIVVGQDHAGLPRILQIICDFVIKQAFSNASDPVLQRMLNVVRQLQANPDLFNSCVSSLTPEQATALHAALQ